MKWRPRFFPGAGAARGCLAHRLPAGAVLVSAALHGAAALPPLEDRLDIGAALLPPPPGSRPADRPEIVFLQQEATDGRMRRKGNTAAKHISAVPIIVVGLLLSCLCGAVCCFRSLFRFWRRRDVSAGRKEEAGFGSFRAGTAGGDGRGGVWDPQDAPKIYRPPLPFRLRGGGGSAAANTKSASRLGLRDVEDSEVAEADGEPEGPQNPQESATSAHSVSRSCLAGSGGAGPRILSSARAPASLSSWPEVDNTGIPRPLPVIKDEEEIIRFCPAEGCGGASKLSLQSAASYGTVARCAVGG